MTKPTPKLSQPQPPADGTAVEDEDTRALLAATLIADAELAEVVLAEAVPMKAALAEAEAAPPEPAPDATTGKPKKPGRPRRVR
jgi:hypothetical protein